MNKKYTGIGALTTCLFLFTACSTVNKTRSSEGSEKTTLDTSKTVQSLRVETILRQKSVAPYIDSGAAITSNGAYRYTDGDTASYTLEKDADDMRVKTTVKPVVKDGKTQGFEVNTSATKKPKTVKIPIDQESVVIREMDTEEKKGITTVETQDKKKVEIHKQPNAWTQLLIKIIVVGVLIGAVIIFLINRKK